MYKDLNKLSRDIIESNQYMVIGTVDAAGKPWVSPVVYAHDKEWNFYFVSIPSSRHGKNIGKQGKVAVAIFDSRQRSGEGVGVQLDAVAEMLPLSESVSAARVYFTRKYPYGKIRQVFLLAFKRLIERKLYRFYKVTPKKVYLNDPNADTDVRVEVKL